MGCGVRLIGGNCICYQLETKCTYVDRLKPSISGEVWSVCCVCILCGVVSSFIVNYFNSWSLQNHIAFNLDGVCVLHA